jgi:hypothetical protein
MKRENIHGLKRPLDRDVEQLVSTDRYTTNNATISPLFFRCINPARSALKYQP